MRWEAIQALRSIGTPEAQRVLIDFLNDDDPIVRTAAAEGFEAFDNHIHIGPLLDVVRQKRFGRRSFREKKALLSVLGRDDSEENIHILKSFLTKRGVLSRKRRNETRVCAAIALGPTHSDAARRLLEKFRRDSSPVVRRACIQALGTGRTQH